MKLLVSLGFLFLSSAAVASADLATANLFDQFLGKYTVSEIQFSNDFPTLCRGLGSPQDKAVELASTDSGPMVIFTNPNYKVSMFLNEFNYKEILRPTSGANGRIIKTQTGVQQLTEEYKLNEEQFSSFELSQQNGKTRIHLTMKLVQNGTVRGDCSYSATLTK